MLVALTSAAQHGSVDFVGDSGDVVLPPASGTHNVAVIMLQGAGITASAYTPLLEQLQKDGAANTGYPMAVWAASPQVALSTVDPLNIGGAILRVQQALTQKGTYFVPE